MFNHKSLYHRRLLSNDKMNINNYENRYVRDTRVPSNVTRPCLNSHHVASPRFRCCITAVCIVCCRSWRGVIRSRPRGVAAPFVVRLAARHPRRPHTYRARAHPRVDSPEVASAGPHPRKGIPWEDC